MQPDNLNGQEIPQLNTDAWKRFFIHALELSELARARRAQRVGQGIDGHSDERPANAVPS